MRGAPLLSHEEVIRSSEKEDTMATSSNEAIAKARECSSGLNIKEKAKLLHSILDEIAKNNSYLLKLRK